MHSPASEVARHKCLIYDGHPSEQLPVVVPLLKGGLEDNFRCLYLGNDEMVQMVDGALAKNGIDTPHECKRGALVFSSDRSHLRDGAFEPNAMIDSLCTAIDDAVRDGYQGLCATGDMRWELGEDKNFDHLLEYEAKLEQVFRDKPLRGICQYHRDLLPMKAVRDALTVHRSTWIGSTLNQDNLFYVPPELLLDPSASKQGEWMYQQILRVLNAERERDGAMAKLEEMNRELEKRVAQRTADLREANRQLEAFSYSVSHDLRAPLRAILGFSDILASQHSSALDEAGRGYLTRVGANAKRMDELIAAMLDFAQAMKVSIQKQPIDLTALVTEIARELGEQRKVDFVVHEGMRAFGDRTLLRAVMTNLLSNAWKFTSKREKAHIEVGQHGEEAGKPIFFVKDNGSGFDMRYAEKLFGVFQRLHSNEDFEGTGVGLATVERIITRHGGRIWAEGRVDRGATFFFTLPAA